ncbi:hypothetical protein B0F90DRAFT_1815045 [Multifurca ochricompacta]|uniref:Uncharacterized protein n=1 Tax=Multifurca ochricompacta TaxID=376703 RepID=A0AAD4M9A6_9AGAM|nr:hypothetical protein B0F90DRAFT_1815045 [Multifurca ochricompacta]
MARRKKLSENDLDSRRVSKSRKTAEQKLKEPIKRKAVDEDSSDSEEDTQPSTKVVKKPRITSQADDDSEHSESASTKLLMSSEGESYVDLGKKKRVTVRSFKGSLPFTSRPRTY